MFVVSKILTFKRGMTMTVATKKTKKADKNTPLSFKALLSMVRKHLAAPSLIKSAVQTGWLTNGMFVTKLTDDEMEQVKEVYTSEPACRRAQASNPEKALPDTVGPMVTASSHGAKTKLTSMWSNLTANVDTRLFLTMSRRHPKASVYLSQDGSACIFSERQTVAVLPTF